MYSVSELFSKWCISKKIKSIESVDLINKLRIEFSEDEKDLLSNKNLFTLCKNHHIRLHTIYGQTYANHLVPKIKIGYWFKEKNMAERKTNTFREWIAEKLNPAQPSIASLEPYASPEAVVDFEQAYREVEIVNRSIEFVLTL